MSKLPSSIIIIPPSFSLFFLIIFLPLNVISQSLDADQSILLNLKNHLGNPPSIQSWTSSSSPCDWPEIQCNDRNDTVTGIRLRDKNIIVQIPPTICEIENLSVLDLAFNYIPGEFPKTLYNCSKLEVLDLSQNCFVGPIPDDIHRLSSNLQYLDIGANNFSGNIPAAIGKLPSMKNMRLYQNLFNGTYPAEIGNLSNLEELAMAHNGFIPSLMPNSFGKLKKLRTLWMTETNLIGVIPESLSNCSSLEHLDLARNNLSGKIPTGLFLLKNLTNVYLYQNGLVGEIPARVEAIDLVGIDLSMNNLTGRIPTEFGSLQKLKILNLFSNQLSGEVPESIGLIPTLVDIRLFSNRLSGVLPPELGLHSGLESFEVSSNQFSGGLPDDLCFGGVLLGIVVFGNNLTGEVPESLGGCHSLRTIQLYDNGFSGDLPSGIWSLFNLSSLMISNNSFEGKLPVNLAWNLSRLEISNNRFYGGIPPQIANWASLVVFKASNNLFSGEIPVELTSLSRLSTLLLDGNQLSGGLPMDVISWTSITTLNLSRNQLSGEIPAAIGSLPDLNYLDLSENQFSGEISPLIGNLRLTFLNFSSNKLSGKIPNEFANLAYETSFRNNSHLCADTAILSLPICSNLSNDSKKPSSTFLALVLVFVILVFISTAMLTLFVVRDYRRKKRGHDLESWKLTSFQRLDFTEANILSSLTENNLIGNGGSGKVYKIGVGRSGKFVAVKRIWSNKKLDEDLEKEFISEVQILGSIRHSNIVKLLCCVSSENSKLLVYEYLENQSLDKWLHKNKRSSTVYRVGLDWRTRVQIAIGAAQGLCYMHHDCSPSIIHRDVKSSNILLDSTFNARIADFGLAKMLVKHGEANTMSAVAGSFGYFAPEYAYTTKVNEKIDVYSFGVVLLELATGRDASEGEESTCLTEWAWKHYADGKNIIDAIDEEITEQCYFEEIMTFFKLGIHCTHNKSYMRPSMKEVLQVLRRCCPFEELEVKNQVASEYDAAPLLDATNYFASYKRQSKSKSNRVPSEDDHCIVDIVCKGT